MYESDWLMFLHQQIPDSFELEGLAWFIDRLQKIQVFNRYEDLDDASIHMGLSGTEAKSLFRDATYIKKPEDLQNKLTELYVFYLTSPDKSKVVMTRLRLMQLN